MELGSIRKKQAVSIMVADTYPIHTSRRLGTPNIVHCLTSGGDTHQFHRLSCVESEKHTLSANHVYGMVCDGATYRSICTMAGLKYEPCTGTQG